jgi:signal transduction histidine kinase
MPSKNGRGDSRLRTHIRSWAGLIRTLLFFLFGILICSTLHGVRVHAADQEKVRVGLYDSPHYAYQNADGTYAGADIEYCYRIAQKAGFEVEITLYDSEADMLQALDSGKADMLFDFGKTEQREQKYLFSENEVGSSAQSLYVRLDDDRFNYGDVEQLSDKVFGAEAGSNTLSVFENWSEDHGMKPNVRLFGSEKEIDEALNDGTIDVGLLSMSGRDGYKTILTFSQKPYYILFRKSETTLKSHVDTSMNQILINDPLYEEHLIEKYNIKSLGVSDFSKDEKQYIQDHPEIRVAVVKGDAPYYYSTSDGKDHGIIPDYYQKLSAFTGLKFTFHPYDTNPDAIAAVKSGEADLLAMFSDGVITAEKDQILLTDAYENVDTVLLTHASTSADQIRKIAVKERSVNNVRQSIAAVMDAEIVPVSNAEAGFTLLRKGSVDAVVCGMPTASWIMNKTNASAYRTNILNSLQFDLCGAAAAGNTTLVSVLDKGISATNFEFDSVVQDNIIQENNWQTMIARIPPIQIAGIAAVFIFIILILVMALVSLVHRQKETILINAAKADNERKQLQLEAIARSTAARNQFFSDVSHDMRTPLTAILGFSDLIRNETDLTKIQAENEKISTSGKLLLQLINDTLLLSKIGNGKLELHLKPVDSFALFDMVITPIQEAAKRKNITFTVDRSRARRRVIMADSLNMQKVLLNLLSNAVKYTPEGGHVSLSFLSVPEGAADPDSVFIVRDDGIGMEEEFQKHMFEPFSQEGRTGYGGSGTGLGLSIVSELVRLMGGTIQCRSKKNEGTLFTVRFHFAEADEKTVQSGEAAAPVFDVSVLKGKSVLLCEDNEMNREIESTLLQEKGMLVTAAENGLAGVAAFQKSPVGTYSVILMDIRMPVMDGFEATKKIRALDRADAGTIPVIAMTADAFPDDVQRCLQAGMAAHVAKPINADNLYRVIASQL